MTRTVVNGAQLTFEQLKERGDRAMAAVQAVRRIHEMLLRESRELHSLIDRQHHAPKSARTV